MAAAAVSSIDLRLLSQSELLSLAAAAPNAFDLRRLADVVPTIDRSVFNESAGSRKQTYSRLPLSPTNPSSANPNPLPRRRGRPRIHPSPAPPPPPSDPSREENLRIVSRLRRLFEKPHERIEPAVEDALALAVVPELDAADREVRNGKGEVVDLVELAEKGDFFLGEELQRRTLGLTTEEQILGYVAGLDGQWGSRRKKRKTVDAAVFMDQLPRGWKLLLWLKKSEGEAFLACRRFISPTGKQFMSCKEVSSYILSLIGRQDVSQPVSDQHEASSLFNPSSVIVPPSSSVVVNDTPHDEPGRSENLQIVSYSHQVFESRETITERHSENVVVKERPSVSLEVGDREVRNAKGDIIDLIRLAENGNLFGEEIRRRTHELRTADQLLDYMKGLEGQWGSSRKKRKIVDASIFGDELPKGWKVLLGLKRKKGDVYLDCRSYVSPVGKQFMSCKEVSSYILSLAGHQDIEQSVSAQYEASYLPNPSSVPVPPSSSATVNDVTCNDNGLKENLHTASYLHQTVTENHSKEFDVKESTSVLVGMGDWEVRNWKGEVVNFVQLAERGDLFMEEEIRRRTTELMTEEQLLDYMKGLEGQWGSTRKKRKIVDAGIFGDELPRGWKLVLGLKRKEAVLYLTCLKYLSPSGRQFLSCKEVSSFLLSLIGYQDVLQPVSNRHEASSLLNPSKILLPSYGVHVNDTISDDPARKENVHITCHPHQLFESREAVTQSHSEEVVVKERTSVLVEVGDREVRNGKGEVINLIQLTEKGDLFGEEIRRRTVGLKTEEELLGYMKGLDGQWGSTRKKRKIVDAGIFGDELPKGWKVLLGLKRKGGVKYLNCRSYVSPTGKQFMSCKEVSLYILSLIGQQDGAVFGQHEASALLNRSSVILSPSPGAAFNITGPDNPGCKENLHVTSYPHQLFESSETIIGNHSKKFVEVKESTSVVAEVGDWEVRNGKGEVVNLMQLAEKGDLFGEEIRRRTAELKTEEELLGYMTGLEGQWGSSRKRRKIVDASIFGDELPRGWRVLLCLKRKEGVVYLKCRRYISPCGKQFMSCKEVSSYIHSLTGARDAPSISCRYDVGASRPELTSKSVANFAHHDVTNKELSNCYIVAPISYNSAECEKQGMLERIEKPGKPEPENPLECRKCKIIFEDNDAQIRHMMTSHGRSAKRRKLGTYLGDVIVKDGVFECQFCHKTFSERHRYTGHLGSHVRYQSSQGGTPLHVAASGTSNSSPSLAVVPYVPPEITMAANKEEETCAANLVDEVRVGPSHHTSVMESNEPEHEPMPDAPEVTESISAGRAVDSTVEACDVIGDKHKEFTEASDGTGTKSPSCRDATFPSVVNAKDVAHVCSGINTQEASTNKSAHFQNDNELMSGKSAIIEDSDLNARVDVIAPAVADVVISTCETIAETLPPSSSKISDNSSSDHYMKSEGIVNTSDDKTIGIVASKSDFVGCQNEDRNMTHQTEYNSDINTCAMSVKGSECYESLPSSHVNVDNATLGSSGLLDSSSQPAISASQYCNGDHKVEVENHLISLSGNGSNYGVEGYTNAMFASSVEEHVEIDEKNSAKGDTGSCHTLTGKDTGVMGTMHNDPSTSYFFPNYTGEQRCEIETTADYMFPGDLNKSILGEFDDVGNELHNCFHSSNSGREHAAAGNIINDDDGGLALQLNVANNSSSWVQSSRSLPILDMIPDQGEDGLGSLGPNSVQGNISGFEELRLGSLEPADFVLMSAQGSGPVARSPIDLFPSDQLEWSLSLPSMGSTVAPTFVCVWCNREFINEDGAADPQSGSLGYMCPDCKARISGQFRGFP